MLDIEYTDDADLAPNTDDTDDADRVETTVVELAAVLGEDRRLVVARELTKLHEELWRGTLGEASLRYRDAEVRGEVARSDSVM